MAKTQKTNAARILDRLHIDYTLVPYRVDESDLGAEHLARELGIDPDRIFKTLVLKGDRSGHFVCVVPGGKELDLKAAARASGNKSCSMLPLRDLQPTTGYVRGGCSPLGMKKHFPTYIDESAILLDRIHISAGVRGLQLLLAPDDLLRAAEAEYAPLADER
ncbi:MAG: Cys-tRNA(Pro) deacylase [Planctomycetaceae bacterium]|nr:Cys-tRNA(Pro) deacylase [Planctomycetaceae bacterium]